MSGAVVSVKRPSLVTSHNPTASNAGLWKKFIDPEDWVKAVRRFPKAPWKYYLKPSGQFSPQEWNNFKRAVQWVWEKASEHRRRQAESLSVRDIFKINALVIFGKADEWPKVLRNNRPIFNYRTTEEIFRVYDRGTCFYRNKDGLSLRVDGFWPAEAKSLDFFACCRALTKASSPQSLERARRSFKGMLYPKVSKRSGRWQVYFLTRRKDLIGQLERVLKWYNEEAAHLLSAQRKGTLDRRKVLELGCKMQRYVDITQFCMDGSGRTSKLVQEYIFLRFGYLPPEPILYQAYGRTWENGTYLPLNKAIQMQLQGWNAGQAES